MCPCCRCTFHSVVHRFGDSLYPAIHSVNEIIGSPAFSEPKIDPSSFAASKSTSTELLFPPSSCRSDRILNLRYCRLRNLERSRMNSWTCTISIICLNEGKLDANVLITSHVVWSRSRDISLSLGQWFSNPDMFFTDKVGHTIFSLPNPVKSWILRIARLVCLYTDLIRSKCS